LLIHEVLRIALFAKVPPAYLAAPESARHAILVLGDVLQYAVGMIDLMGFVVMFGMGFSAFAIAILSLRVIPRWLGWTLLIPAVGVGLIAFPLGYLGFASAGLLVLPATGGPPARGSSFHEASRTGARTMVVIRFARPAGSPLRAAGSSSRRCGYSVR
jgi:hypothetical protein